MKSSYWALPLLILLAALLLDLYVLPTQECLDPDRDPFPQAGLFPPFSLFTLLGIGSFAVFLTGAFRAVFGRLHWRFSLKWLAVTISAFIGRALLYPETCWP